MMTACCHGFWYISTMISVNKSILSVDELLSNAFASSSPHALSPYRNANRKSHLGPSIVRGGRVFLGTDEGQMRAGSSRASSGQSERETMNSSHERRTCSKVAGLTSNWMKE